MDIASWPWLNPIMRSGFLAACGLLALSICLPAQEASSPIVLNHPPGVVAYIGDTVTLTPSISGTAPITYQWQKDGTAIPGATNLSLTLPSVRLNDLGNYHVVASNAYGTAQTIPALVYVTKRPQTISLSPTVTTAVAGSSVVLNATSSSNLPVTLTLVSGAATLSGNILTGSGGGVLVRASQPGDDTYAAAETVERMYTFVAGSLSPFITSPPLDQSVTAGDSVTWRAAAIGTPAPTYQWSKDGVAIAGATTTTLNLAKTTPADAGRYTLTATNAAGTATASATLTVRFPPSITSAPASQTVFAGEHATFTVGVTGVPSPTFQWRKNGANLAGATNSTLTFASTAAADAGRYEVVVTNALGSTTSEPATLTVTTRDFSGGYFGGFTGTAGQFALHVRADRTAVFLSHLPAQQTGVVVQNLRLDLAGNFSANTTTLASMVELSAIETRPDIAAAPQPVTLRGRVDDQTGTVSGTITGLNVVFEGSRAARTGAASAWAGLYQAAVIGTASDRGVLLVAPDGQAFVLSASGTNLDSARGTVDTNGRLTATSTAQATLDLTMNNGGLTGTVRSPAGGTGQIAGAIETRAGSEHVANLSVRTLTSQAAPLITGFVVTGSSAKQVLIRAAGPALAAAPFNIANALADPTLQLFRGSTSIGQNDEWGTPAANVATLTAAATRAGAFPFRNGSQDAALLMTLTPGPYTVVIGGGNGTALAEVYEVLQNNEPAGARRLVNVSARGLVSPNAPFIAGFVISGTAPQRVLIRGIGPTLGASPFNVAGTLPNPQLTLYRGSTVVKSNDEWFRDPDAALIREAAARAGAFALGANSADAALLLYLAPGAYTAQISGPANANAANSTGLAMIEIYESTVP
jgi:hypothetical protein